MNSVSIRHIGEQAGICKIVPPAGWRPPFAINDKTFRFRTRVQQLNCLDGHSRAEGNFVEALRMFLYRSGAPMQQLPRVHGQLVNLRLLYRTVRDLGGFDAVSAAQLWPQVVRRVGRTRSADQPDDALCAAYRTHYETCLLAFERHKTAESPGASSFQTPEVIKRSTTSDASSRPSAASIATTIPATPLTKTRGSMKKAARESEAVATPDRESPGTAAAAAAAAAGCSPRVKRTLFSEGDHTSSEENDAQTEKKVRVKSERGDHLDEDAATPAAAATTKSKPPENLSPSGLKPNAARKHRLEPPEIHAGQQFYRFFPEAGAVLAQVKRVFGGKKPHVAVQYVNDGSRDDIDLPTMQILIANGWDAYVLSVAWSLREPCPWW